MASTFSDTSQTAPVDILVAKRQDIRVAGPFDGRWVGALTVPLHIHDLSLGGCLIQAFHEQAPGRRFSLEIEVPYEGWMTFEAESIDVLAKATASQRSLSTCRRTLATVSSRCSGG